MPAGSWARVARPARNLVFPALLLAAALAVPLGGSLPEAPALAEEVQLEAAATQDGVELAVAASGDAASVQVVLSHDDPLEGTLIDRVVDVPVEAGWSTNVTLRDVRPGVGFNVSVLPAGVELPALDAGVSLPDAQGLAEAAPLAQEAVAPLRAPGQGPVHRFQGYPVSENPMWGGPIRVLVTDEGRVLAGWVRFERPEDLKGSLVVAASSDGGHTFPVQAVVSEAVGNGFDGWAWALDARQQLHVVYGEMAGDGAALGPTRHASVDPASGEVTLRQDFPDGWRLMRVSVAAVGDGLLVVGAGASQGGRWPYERDLQVWRIGAEGPSRLGSLPSAGDALPAYVASNAAGEAAVVWSRRDGTDAPMVLCVARTPDGGASFSEVQVIEAPRPQESVFTQSRPVLDEDGTLHAGLHLVPAQPASFEKQAAYLRVPAGGEPVLREVTGNASDRILPDATWASDLFIAGSGPRVWMYLVDVTPTGPNTGQLGSFLAESVDGGQTFSAFRTLNLHGYSLAGVQDMALFPDGRPILSGSYAYTLQSQLVSVMPFFDPVPPLGSLVVTIHARAAPASWQAPTGRPAQETGLEAPDDGADGPAGAPLPFPVAAAALLVALAAARRRPPGATPARL